MNTRHLYLFIAGMLSVALLSGCESRADVRAQDRQQCREYGYKPGHTAFARCMQSLDERRQAIIDSELQDNGPHNGHHAYRTEVR